MWKFPNNRKVNKRHVLLLEVLIAFALIVMCIIPLLYPHTFILKEQKQFIHRIELDHVVNLLLADITERLYLNEIPWNDIANKTVFQIEETELRRINYSRSLPFKGSYQFGETIHKPKGEAAYSLYLLTLDITFTPEPPSKHKKEEYVYHYDIFLVRDLGTAGETPTEGEAES